MTYNVFGGMLNLAQSVNPWVLFNFFFCVYHCVAWCNGLCVRAGSFHSLFTDLLLCKDYSKLFKCTFFCQAV